MVSNQSNPRISASRATNAHASANAASTLHDDESNRSTTATVAPSAVEVPNFFRPVSMYYAYSSRQRINHDVPRLVKRDLQFHQSRNALQIEMKDLSKFTWNLQREDWYHVFLQQSNTKSITVLLIPWTLCILIFAGLYMAVDRAYAETDCGLVSSSENSFYGTYFAFSLETCTTVGYGLPGSTNAFFENCPIVQMVIYFQMVQSMLFNAFFFAFVFATLSRTEARGAQVIFSNTAILKRKDPDDSDDEDSDSDDDEHEEGEINGNGDGNKSVTAKKKRDKSNRPWVFQFRVTDVDAANPVVEAHVRIYAKKESKMYHMRTYSPDDDMGGVLFLSWPNTISHEIDVHSPLYPPLAKKKEKKYRLASGSLNLRNADSYTGSVEQFCCPVCSEVYGDMDRLRNHVKFNQLIESSDDIPIEGSHQAYSIETDFPTPTPPTLAELKASFPDEVICVVEGIDRIASGTFQALQSYTLSEMEFGGEFKDCLFFSKNKTIMDLSQFHTVERAPEEEDTSESLGIIVEEQVEDEKEKTDW